MTSVQCPQAICWFGLARCDITPPVGIYHRMWGAAAHDRATGVHRPLTATAMVFRDPTSSARGASGLHSEQILVAVDHCLLWAPEMDSLLRAVCQQTGIPREQIAVTFSHTHSSGLMDLTRKNLPGGELIAGYLDSLAHRVAQIIVAAREKLEQATMTFGAGSCSLAGQRDFPDPKTGQYVCGFNPAAGADDTVLLGRVTGSDGLLAIVVNYACHPTTLAWANTLISPDFPGAMRELVEKATGAPCVFIQGASGDLGPRQGFVGDPDVADRNGRQLGYAVLSALESLPPPGTRFTYKGPVISGATLGSWAHEPLTPQQTEQLRRWQVRRFTIDLSYLQELPSLEQNCKELAFWQEEEASARAAGNSSRASECRAMVERMTRWRTRLEVLPPGPVFPFPVTMWRTGTAIWLAVEGELYNLFQRTLRWDFDDYAIVLATLSNGSRCSYLPTTVTYGKGIYQESIAVLAPGCLETLIDKIGEQIRQWTQTSC